MAGQDITLGKNADGLFDLVVTDGDFAPVDGFQTALEVSLLTDARAREVNTTSLRRGYVGDILTSDIGRSLGSTLWLYEQARLTPDIMNAMQDAAENSLLWMIDDGQALSVEAKAVSPSARVVEITIDIRTNEGRFEQYQVLWRQTLA